VLRAHHLPMVRLRRLIVVAALCSAIVAVSAQAALPASRGRDSSSARTAAAKSQGSRSSRARRAACVTASARHKHRGATKSCARRSKGGASKPPATSAPAKPSAPTTHSESPALVEPFPGAEAPTLAPAPETPSVEGSPKETPPAEKPPAETPPAEKPPAEKPPAEKPPAEKPPAEKPVEKPPVEKPVEPPAPFRFFSPTSFWNAALPADAPLDPSSAAVVSAFSKEIAKEEEAKIDPFINTAEWSVPIYTVAADQPTVKVTLERAERSPALQKAWEAVPLPAGAKPALGTDKHLVVWQPSSDRLWEFWRLEHTSEGWQAPWGGAIENASASSGVYGPEAWPGANLWWGASATSLSIAGGLITLEDLEKGQINHALAMAIPDPREGVYTSPAQRTDGESAEPLSLPEGAHLRLEPGLDLAALHLPRFTLMLAEAAQRYGIVVRDKASEVTFYGQDPLPTGSNPYSGPHGYFEGKTPQQLLASFPWSHLQLLKMELHSSS
jgi:hypothetical protein